MELVGHRSEVDKADFELLHTFPQLIKEPRPIPVILKERPEASFQLPNIRELTYSARTSTDTDLWASTKRRKRHGVSDPDKRMSPPVTPVEMEFGQGVSK